jgi:N-methylhydantoinase B
MAAGSMPAGATEIFQEGLVIPPVRFTEDVRAMVLANCRSPVERDGDLRAQEAAGRLAGARLLELEERAGGREGLEAGSAALLDLAEARTRAAIAAMPDGTHRAEEWLESDGAGGGPAAIRVAVTIAGDALTVDFAGTDPAVRGNVNCPASVTASAVLFAVRCLTDPDLPANDGVLRAVDLRVPEGCLIAAGTPAAVAAGNVETSCRIADAVLAALGDAVPDRAAAQGQGTCNNLALGVTGPDGRRVTHYETLGGGQGASRRGPGPDGAHVTMSNTQNSPVEALEAELPLRVVRYALRRGSGGRGRHRGGEGAVRALRFLGDGEASLLAERRLIAPRGLDGGGDGAPGEDLLDGAPIPGKARVEIRAGQILEVRTPGGGGWGAPAD